MISFLNGKVFKVSRGDKRSFIDLLTNSGIAYRISINNAGAFKLEQELGVYTSFQVREDSQTLYGFLSESERDFFELLLTVSGIGPRSAMAILDFYGLDEVATHILNKDADSLSKVPGLGKKGAQKIVLELENKLEPFDYKIKGKKSKNTLILKELSDALTSLGFSGKALTQYMEKAGKYVEKVEKIDELIKIVLAESD